VWILAAAGRLLGVGGLQLRVARPKSRDSCCFQGVVGVVRQAEFWELHAARNAYSQASEVIRMARGRLRGELAMPDDELGTDS
jgi:hypothetical protein